MTSFIPKSNTLIYLNNTPSITSRENRDSIFSCSNPFTVRALEYTGISPASLTYSTPTENTRSEEDPILCATSFPASPTTLSYSQESLDYKSFLALHKASLENLRKRKLETSIITTSKRGATNTIRNTEETEPTIDQQALHKIPHDDAACIAMESRGIILKDTVPLQKRQIQMSKADKTITNSRIRLLQANKMPANSTIASDTLIQKLSHDSMTYFESILLDLLHNPRIDQNITVMHTPLILSHTQYHAVIEFLKIISDHKEASVILNEDIKNILMPLYELLLLSHKLVISEVYCSPTTINIITKMLALSKVCRQPANSSNNILEIPMAINEIQVSPEYMLAKSCADPIAKKLLLTVSPEYLLFAYSTLLQIPHGNLATPMFISNILQMFLSTIESVKRASPNTEYLIFNIPTTLQINGAFIINEEHKSWLLTAMRHVLSAAKIRIPGSSDVSIIDQAGADHINIPFEALHALYINVQQSRAKMILGCSSMHALSQEIAPTLKLLCKHIIAMSLKYPNSVCKENSNTFLQFISIPLLCDVYSENHPSSIFLHERHIKLLIAILSYTISRMLEPSMPSIFPLPASEKSIPPNEYNILGEDELLIIHSHLTNKLTTTRAEQIHIHQAGFIICKTIIQIYLKNPSKVSDIKQTCRFGSGKWKPQHYLNDTILTKKEARVMCNLIDSILEKFF